MSVIIRRAEDRAAPSSFLTGSLHLRAPKIGIRGTTATASSRLAVGGSWREMSGSGAVHHDT